jgi:hypothetical protein
MTFSKIAFRHRTTDKVIFLSWNKTKKLLKYRNKWIPQHTIYDKGYEDANVSGKCVECDRPIDGHRWACEECDKRRKILMSEIVGEVSQLFQGAGIKI